MARNKILYYFHTLILKKDKGIIFIACFYEYSLNAHCESLAANIDIGSKTYSNQVYYKASYLIWRYIQLRGFP